MKENYHRELARHRMDKAFHNLSKARGNFQLGFFDEAVTKSYYAVLTAMHALLAVLHLDSERHEGVITLFHQHIVSKNLISKKYNKIITKLKKMREDADYGDYIRISKENAEQGISHAEEFVKAAALFFRNYYRKITKQIFQKNENIAI